MTEILEHNKDMRDIKQIDEFGEGWTYLFEIPNNVVLEWIQKHDANLLLAKWGPNGRPLNEHAVKVARLLNDPEWAALRTSNYKNPLASK